MNFFLVFRHGRCCQYLHNKNYKRYITFLCHQRNNSTGLLNSACESHRGYTTSTILTTNVQSMKKQQQQQQQSSWTQKQKKILTTSSNNNDNNNPRMITQQKDDDVIWFLKDIHYNNDGRNSILDEYSMDELQDLVQRVVTSSSSSSSNNLFTIHEVDCDYIVPLSDACAKQNCIQGAECTEYLLAHILEQSLLHQLHEQKQQQPSTTNLVCYYPSPFLYQSCLQAWSNLIVSTSTTNNNNNTLEEYAMRAQRVWELQWEEYYQSINSNTIPPPTVTSLAILLNIWAKVGNPIRADYTLQQLLSADEIKLIPDVACFETVMYAYSKQTNNNNHQRQAHTRIQELIQQLQNAPINEQPSIQSFNYLISTSPSPSHAEQILQENILSQEIQPNIHTFNILLSHYNKQITISPNSNNYDNIQQIYQIIASLRQDKNNSTIPGMEIYGIDQKEESIDNHNYTNNDVIPNVVTYNTLLSALAKIPDATTAHSILQLLEQEYWNEDNDEDTITNIITYNTVLLAYCRQGLMKEAYQFLQQHFQSITPNVISYATLLQGYLVESQKNKNKKNKEKYGDFVQNTIIRSDMIERHQLQPNTSCYQSLIQLYIQENNPKSAQEILFSTSTVVNTFTLNTLLSCWSNLGDYRNVIDLLQYQLQHTRKTQQQQHSPNTSSYHMALTACVSSKTKQKNNNDDALAAAQLAWKLMKQHHTVTQQAYFLMMKAIQLLSSNKMEGDRKINLLKYYFQQCCQDGYLNNSILKIIKSSLSPSQFNDILKDQLLLEKDNAESELGRELQSQNNDNGNDITVSITTRHLPRKWSRSSNKKKQKHKRQTAKSKRYNSK